MEENEITLEQLRSDYYILKESLAQQEIVTDRLLRQTMKASVHRMRRTPAISVACAAFVMLFAPLLFHYNPAFHTSWWFVAGTELLMACCAFFELKANGRVQNSDLGSCDLLSFVQKVRDLKQFYRRWMRWCFIPAILWVFWLGLEIWHNSSEPKQALLTICGLAAGFIAGGIIGWMLDLNIIRNCNEIIAQIEE